MFPQELIDSLTILIMFGLRIGLPLALTLAFGYWLEKKLSPRREDEQDKTIPLRLVKTSDKIIQLHCWDIKRCDSATRAQCSASKHPELPCWLALQAEGEKVREECFTCALYKPQAIAA